MATGALAGGAAVIQFPPRRARRRAPWRTPPAAIVLALTIGGLILRLAASRGLWLDKATEVSQTHLSYGGMLHVLATTDVHPPLHHTVLWLTVRLFGDGELAVRLPSLIAADTADPGALSRRLGAVRPPRRPCGGRPRRSRAVPGLVLAGGADVRVLHALRDDRGVDAGARAAPLAAAPTGSATRSRRPR